MRRRRGRAGRAPQAQSPVAGAPAAPRSGAALDRMSGWVYATEAIGAPGLHFHDLRHTGNSFAAASGAGLKDLMARMGHDSERAAMIYLHEMRGADLAITRAIDAHVQAERDQLAQANEAPGQTAEWHTNGTRKG